MISEGERDYGKGILAKNGLTLTKISMQQNKQNTNTTAYFWFAKFVDNLTSATFERTTRFLQ